MGCKSTTVGPPVWPLVEQLHHHSLDSTPARRPSSLPPILPRPPPSPSLTHRPASLSSFSRSGDRPRHRISPARGVTRPSHQVLALASLDRVVPLIAAKGGPVGLVDGVRRRQGKNVGRGAGSLVEEERSVVCISVAWPCQRLLRRRGW